MEYAMLIRETLSRISRAGMPEGKVIVPCQTGLWRELPDFSVHVCYEIFMQLEGGCTFRFPDEEISLFPGDLLLVAPGMPHQERSFNFSGKAFRNLLITLSEEYLDIHIAESPEHGPLRNTPEPVFPESVFSERKGLYCKLAESVKISAALKKGNEDILGFRVIQTLSAMMLEELGDPLASAGGNDEIGQEHYKVAKAKLIINRSDLAGNPSVQELAERVGCSANYLSWIFRQETGETLKTYRNRVKMERASNMLLYTNRSIGEIAWACGFKDAAYFSRLFEKFNGRKPSDFRRHHS